MRTTIFFFCFFFLFSCSQEKHNSDDTLATADMDTTTEALSFFPLGNYIQGQIVDIKKSGINPFKLVKKENGEDTTWIHVEDFDTVFGEFYTPNIDSSSYHTFFKENKFFDQTLNAITLTYSATGQLTDSIPWRYWNIYIDPETNEITRIFMVKETGPDLTRQLTWIPGTGAKAVTINKNVIENETNIKWSYK